MQNGILVAFGWEDNDPIIKLTILQHFKNIDLFGSSTLYFFCIHDKLINIFDKIQRKDRRIS